MIWDILENTYKGSIKNKITYINKDEIGLFKGTYVVADISKQTLKIYEGRKKILEKPIVSDTKTKTPSTEGCFEIYSKTRNRYLVGPGYKTYVDIMMKYHGGEGMHDAAIKACKLLEVGDKVLVKE